MERGSPSLQRSWADEVEEELGDVSSPPLPPSAAAAHVILISRLNPYAEPFHGSPSSTPSGGRLHFSDSEELSEGPVSPPPAGRGKEVAQPQGRRRRRRNRGHRPVGFMADARRGDGILPTPPRARLASVIVSHRPRMSAPPDADGGGC